MTTNTLDERLERSRRTFENKYAFPATIGTIIILIIIYAFSKYFAAEAISYWMNLVTEGIGIAITVLIIDRLNEYRVEQHRKQELVYQASSRSNNVAVDAIEKLSRGGWLEGESSLLQKGSLEKANLNKLRLMRANLKGAYLWGVSLEKAVIGYTDMEEADIRNANLKSVDLTLSSLRDSKLLETDFREALLLSTNLENSDVYKADFRGAYLIAANFRNVTNIEYAYFDGNTVLPDAEALKDKRDIYLVDHETGEQLFDKYWTPETDMTRYTDPNHPDFWEPDWVKAQRENNAED